MLLSSFWTIISKVPPPEWIGESLILLFSGIRLLSSQIKQSKVDFIFKSVLVWDDIEFYIFIPNDSIKITLKGISSSSKRGIK